MTLETLQRAGSVAALAVGVFVFASPHYAQTMTTSDTDAVVVAAAPATSCSSRPERSTRRGTSAAATGRNSPRMSSKKGSRSSCWLSERPVRYPEATA